MLYLDEVRPSVAANTYLRSVRIGAIGTVLASRAIVCKITNTNGCDTHSRVMSRCSYRTKLRGKSLPILFLPFHQTDSMNVAARSFKLKKGYMAPCTIPMVRDTAKFLSRTKPILKCLSCPMIWISRLLFFG